MALITKATMLCAAAARFRGARCRPKAGRITKAAMLFCAAATVGAQTPLNERVLVVSNSGDSESRSVARYYMAQRRIPPANQCAIAPPAIDSIEQRDYESRVRAPLRQCIEALGKEKILYIVFSYHTPYVVRIDGRGFALDSVAADLWDEYASNRPGNEIPLHPYFSLVQSQGNVYPPFVSLSAYRARPHALNIYSVWRLDAARADLARGLVDKALYAEQHGLSGKGCFDLQFAPAETLADYASAAGDWDVHQSAEFARRAGFDVIEEATPAEFGTPPAPARCDAAAFYAGWYSLGRYNDVFTWQPGAIGFHLDSASATDPRRSNNWSGGAVLKGITITSGAAAEPYLEGLPHPDQVFAALFQGANAGDALLQGTRWLKWMILNIGDPLYRPFPKGAPMAGAAGLALVPQNIAGGNTVAGFAGLPKTAAEGGVVVTLASSQPDIVVVPKSVTVLAGAISARFPILTHPVKEVTTVRITMTAGEARRSNTLVVHPPRAR
jgi:uncharacterized protein (TIGR03790 family)